MAVIETGFPQAGVRARRSTGRPSMPLRGPLPTVRMTWSYDTRGDAMHKSPGQSGVGELRTMPDALATPLPVECLGCYVWRMLDEYGCNATLRWACRWRDARAPRATAL